MYIGLDIGSISVNAVVMNSGREIREDHYQRIHGQPIETTLRVLQEIFSRTPREKISGIAVTGSGGSLVAKLINCFFVNEIIAQSKATICHYPDIRSIIEIGGEDAKLILLEQDPDICAIRIKDFAMNTVCAAGTGSFLDQQATRLGVNIENEFGQLALKSTRPPRIAGRCSVFAKSDMIHLQQTATPDYDIVMGLCLALARNFRSNVAKGMELERGIAFQGGVAANCGIVRAFEMILELDQGELLIPEYFASMGAIGAVLTMVETKYSSDFRGPEALEQYLGNRSVETLSHEPLDDQNFPLHVNPETIQGDVPVDGYLGVDVGSISTNVVVIDKNRRVIARRYLMTAGRPIEAVRKGLFEIGKEIGDRVIIKGATTTGSGRYLTGDIIGADLVKNEITAHARGAVNIDPNVDTIFEIGGQDSKYISLENGAVIDFTMNKVCAAGTGSFLEEQAEKLDINIKEDFGKLALSSGSPVRLGERCTVFMESSLNRYQQIGAEKEDLVAGLSYSIVLNYLNRVVEDRRVGDVIFFQGGTAYNHGVIAAFEKICEKKIMVPPHHDVLGAIGAALIALENNSDGPSKFKGFDLTHLKYTVDTFECRDCPNNCEIRKVSIQGEKPLHYGSRCGKYDEEKRESLGKDLPKLFDEREQILFSSYIPARKIPDKAPTIGIPRATIYFEMFPFWNAFFSELGFNVVSSPATNRTIMNDGCEKVVEETCFPIKVAHGHVLELLQSNVDYLFLPCVVNMEHISNDAETSYNCPYIQGLPYVTSAAVNFDKFPTKVLKNVFHFQWGPDQYIPQLRKLARNLGCRGKKVDEAIAVAFNAFQNFKNGMEERGRQVLANLPADRPSLVIVSRPYNGCDPALNFHIPEKLRDLGALAIPLDFLPVHHEFGSAMKSMYWRYGQRILSAGLTIARHPNLHAVYITNFGCGPDSFISKYFHREMNGKPYLTIELDEHSADAGVITRLEAFLDSLQTAHPKQKQPKPLPVINPPSSISGNHRKVYVPYMDDHGIALAAAMRFKGLDAEALPMADEKTIEIGRRYTTGKECYPCIITTGDILKKALSDEFDPEHSSFFMPSATGPCRFGQYSRFHRMVLDDLGMDQVPMMVLDQTVNYEQDLQSLGNGFRLLTWKSLILIDYMKKLLLQTRPYEINSGDSDAVYDECLKRVIRTVEQCGNIGDCAEYSVRAFSSIPVNRRERKPLIGMVGEIYVRSNQFSNNFIIRKIEKNGGEAVMPTLQEWIEYTDWERRKDLWRTGNFRGYISELIKVRVQKYNAWKIRKPFQETIDHFSREESTEKIIKLCSPYSNEHFRGETNLSMGRAVEYAHRGFHGVVNLMPFNCMPGTVVNALLCRFAQDYPRIPILKMIYDGTAQSSEKTRIEAFMYQARQVCETSKRKHS